MKSSGKIKLIIAGLIILFVLGLSVAAQTSGSDGRSGQTVGSGGFTTGGSTEDGRSSQIFGSGARAGDDGGMIGSGTLAATADSGSFYCLIQSWLEDSF